MALGQPISQDGCTVWYELFNSSILASVSRKLPSRLVRLENFRPLRGLLSRLVHPENFRPLRGLLSRLVRLENFRPLRGLLSRLLRLENFRPPWAGGRAVTVT